MEEKETRGKLYGVGVGPGDPMLLTLKAAEVIQGCDVIAVPGKDKHASMAYQIASGVVELEPKECLEIAMPMTRNRRVLDSSHEKGIEQLEKELSAGKDIAFLTLGDPTVYSTYLYLHQGIAMRGYETEIVSGVPSFCAAAGRLNISLAEGPEEIHVIPAGYGVKEAAGLPGTKVFMKAGSTMGELKRVLQDTDDQVYMVENCGMEQEKQYFGAQEIDENAGYYSIVIVKEEKER